MAPFSVVFEFSYHVFNSLSPSSVPAHKDKISELQTLSKAHSPATLTHTDSSESLLSPLTQRLQQQVREIMRRGREQAADAASLLVLEAATERAEARRRERESVKDKESLFVLVDITARLQKKKAASQTLARAPVTPLDSSFEHLDWTPVSGSSRFSPPPASVAPSDPFVGYGTGNDFEKSLTRFQDLRRSNRIIQSTGSRAHSGCEHGSPVEDLFRTFHELAEADRKNIVSSWSEDEGGSAEESPLQFSQVVWGIDEEGTTG